MAFANWNEKKECEKYHFEKIFDLHNSYIFEKVIKETLEKH
jgi:hypothetical protein